MSKVFSLALLLGAAIMVGCGGSNTTAVPEGYESAAPAGENKQPIGDGEGEGAVQPPPPPPPQ